MAYVRCHDQNRFTLPCMEVERSPAAAIALARSADVMASTALTCTRRLGSASGGASEAERTDRCAVRHGRGTTAGGVALRYGNAVNG
jgi:hypothetical protein